MKSIILFMIIAFVANLLNPAKRDQRRRGSARYTGQPIERPDVIKPQAPIDMYVNRNVMSQEVPQDGNMSYSSLEGLQTEGEAYAVSNGSNQSSKPIQVDDSIDLPVADLGSSVVMAEILGPPRALKRSIR